MSINEKNYKEHLLDYLDNRLSAADRKDMEHYLLLNSDAWAELEALKRIKLKPDMSVSFPKKALLMMPEEEDAAAAPLSENTEQAPVRRLGWWQLNVVAGIAALLLLALLFRLNHKSAGLTNNAPQVAIGDKKPDTKPVEKKGKAKPKSTIILVDGEKEKTEIAKAENKSMEKAFRQNDLSLAAIYASKKKKTVQGNAKPQQINLVKNMPATIDKSIAEVALVNEPVLPVTVANGQDLAPIKEIALAANNTAEEENDEDGPNPLQYVLHFFRRNVKIEKESIGGEKYYAVSVETERVRIYKTIRAEF
jgi:hypothetical protein